MKKTKIVLSLTLMVIMLLSSCNLPRSKWDGGTATTGPDQIGTAAAKTVEALSTMVAATVNAPPVPTNTLPAAATSLPTDTKAPTETPVPSATPTKPTATTAIFDNVSGLQDITFPDGIVVAAGTTFVKTWRLTNGGTTTWGAGYALVFTGGDAMNTPASVPITTSIPPKGTLDVSVTLTTPVTAKTYTGFYKLRNASGVLFGYGQNNDQAFWVKVTVGTPTAAVFSVVSVPTTVDLPSWSGACSQPLTFTAKIKANGPGVVKYHWERSDGSQSVQTLTYSEAGTKTITTTWSPGVSLVGWAAIYIDQPNHQWFEKADFTFTCP
ncbi:MAG: hypothetical protein IMZ61_16565 [Planctomycetes bacterium]|nr:hypothetical protein [Planctomycetota bacterium]